MAAEGRIRRVLAANRRESGTGPGRVSSDLTLIPLLHLPSVMVIFICDVGTCRLWVGIHGSIGRCGRASAGGERRAEDSAVHDSCFALHEKPVIDASWKRESLSFVGTKKAPIRSSPRTIDCLSQEGD